jgi:rRNA maturation endonuclease Nob1
MCERGVYACKNCGSKFKVPVKVPHRYMIYFDIELCPRCGSDQLVEIIETVEVKKVKKQLCSS